MEKIKKLKDAIRNRTAAAVQVGGFLVEVCALKQQLAIILYYDVQAGSYTHHVNDEIYNGYSSEECMKAFDELITNGHECNHGDWQPGNPYDVIYPKFWWSRRHYFNSLSTEALNARKDEIEGLIQSGYDWVDIPAKKTELALISDILQNREPKFVTNC